MGGVGIAVVAVLCSLGWILLRRYRFAAQLRAARAEGRWSEVVRLLQPVDRRRPGHKKARRSLAEAFIALERFDATSEPHIAELAAEAPTDDHRWALARCRLSEGDDSDESLELFADLIGQGRSDVGLHRALGAALLSRGQAGEAVGHLDEVYGRDPEDVEIGRQVCEAHVQTETLDKTFLQAALTQVQLGRGDAALCAALCQAAVEQHSVNDPAVSTAAEIALAGNDSEPWALLCHGLSLIDEGDWNRIPALISKLPTEGAWARHALPLHAMLAAEGLGADPEGILRRHCREFQSHDPRVVRRIAERLAASGRRDEVTQAHCELAMVQPDCPVEVLEALAQCFAAAGKTSEQAQVLGRLAAAQPDRPERWQAFGLLSADLRRTDTDAKEAYVRVLDKPPRDPEKLRRFLTACGAAGVQDPRISELCQRLMVDHPDDPELGLMMIRLLLEQGAAAEAHRRGLELAGRVAESDLEATELFARAAFEAKDFEQATPHYLRLHHSQPDSPVWIKFLAMCLSRQSRHDEKAIDLYRRIAELEPEDAVVQMILARGLLQSGQVDEGVACVRLVLRRQQELAPQIVRLLTRVLETLPREGADPVRVVLADLLSEQGEFAEAAAHINEMVTARSEDTQEIALKIERLAGRTPDNLDALQALGLLYLRRDEPQRAREVLLRAAQIDAESTDVAELLVTAEEMIVAANDTAENRLRLGEHCIGAGRIDQALTILQPIQDDVFLFRPVRMALTKAYLVKGLTELAWQTLQAITIDDSSKQLFYDMGEQFLAAGNLETARDVWRKLYSADIAFRDMRDRYERLVEEIRQQEAGVGVEGPASLASVGDRLFQERFDLEEEVGAGGMGRVYRVQDKTLDEVVAIKVLPPEMASNPEIVERLKGEVKAARQLTHPHIIRIHDFGALGEMKFISMEFIEGPTLKQLIRTAPGLAAPQKMRFAHQMAEALAYAHRRGVIHRDIKPANIMIAQGESVKITDFGIAKVVKEGASEASATRQIVGTPLYMSPEQIRGEAVDGRADVYSFGVTLFEMLMGHPPFQEGDLTYLHLTQEPPMVEGVSPRLQALVKKCLMKAPEDRWERFEEVADELTAMDTGDAAFSAASAG
jgi:tetratricopeptide (TPR) repeat protein